MMRWSGDLDIFSMTMPRMSSVAAHHYNVEPVIFLHGQRRRDGELPVFPGSQHQGRV